MSKAINVIYLVVKTADRLDTAFVKSQNWLKTRSGIWVKSSPVVSSENTASSLGAIPNSTSKVFRFLRFLPFLSPTEGYYKPMGVEKGSQPKRCPRGVCKCNWSGPPMLVLVFRCSRCPRDVFSRTTFQKVLAATKVALSRAHLQKTVSPLKYRFSRCRLSVPKTPTLVKPSQIEGSCRCERR